MVAESLEGRDSAVLTSHSQRGPGSGLFKMLRECQVKDVKMELGLELGAIECEGWNVGPLGLSSHFIDKKIEALCGEWT